MKTRSGMTQFSVTRGEEDLELEVSWVYEESEYGDGSLDEEFETMAYCGSEEIPLTEAVGYMAPFSVKRMFNVSKFSNLLTGNISLSCGSEG